MRLVFLFVILPYFLSFSQEHIKQYTSADGLPHDVLYKLFQDSKGYLWIGTDNGVAKFNGQEFKVFSVDDGLRTNFVIDMAEDNDGNIALATWKGGLHFIKNDTIIIPEIIHSPGVNADSNERINNIFKYKDDFFVRRNSTNIIYEQVTEFKYHKKYKIVNEDHTALIDDEPDDEGTKGYFSKIDSSLVIVNHSFPKRQKVFNLKGVYQVGETFGLTPIYPFLKDKVIHNIDKISDTEFAVTQRDSLFICNPNRILHRKQLPIKDDLVVKVLKTKHWGYLVLTTDTKAFKNAYLFSEDFTKVIDLKDYLKIRSTISDVLEDHEHNIWISTFGDGLFCFEQPDTTIGKFDNNVLPELWVKGITAIDEDVFILTPNHVTKLNEKNKQVINLEGFGSSIIKYQDTVYVSSLKTPRKPVIKHQNIKEFQEFSNILELDSLGLVFINDSIKIQKSNITFHDENQIMGDATLYKDTLWLATTTGTFYGNQTLGKIKRKDILDKKLLSSQINKFLKIEDTLWVATAKGLSKIEPNKVTHFTEKEGLIDDYINTLYLDHNNHIWIGTQKGISVYDGAEFLNIYPGEKLNSPYVEVIYEDSHNQVWIGSNKGISIIDNSIALELKPPPIINIKQRKAAFEYEAISFNQSHTLICQYKLDKNSWTELPNVRGTLNFGGYQKGNYQIQFRAKKQDGAWGYSEGYSFRVTIPWYKDWFYITLFTVTISSFVILFIIHQLQDIRVKNKELHRAMTAQEKLKEELSQVREHIAQDFHDDLGNKLARISLLSNMVLSDTSKKDEKVQTKIAQISEDADSLYKGTRDFIFSLKEESDNLEELVTYLSDFGEDYFRKTDIKFILRKNIAENTKLPYYWSKQLIYIFKEAMTNVLKHAQCDRVILSFRYKNNVLTIKCIDNGIGYIVEDKLTSNGIHHMRKRAKKVGGSLKLISSENKGTMVRFFGKTVS